MRPVSREVLARDAAVKLAAAEMPDGACTRHGLLWSVLESAHRRATKPAEARDVITAIRGEFCGSCPARLACHQLAVTAEYTGLAAGAAYEKGVRQDATWTAPKPGKAGRRTTARTQKAS